jgi:SAM-dependent methyltransferase
MSEAYGAFAYAYDQSLGRRFFNAARVLLDQTLEQYPTPKRTHLDVACGTGFVVKYFRERGWQSIGVDASIPMLRLGVVRASGAPSGGRLIAADMRALPLRRKFARITCLYDSLNHLLDRNDLVAAFRAMRALMHHDSLLLFDMNHIDIYPAIWGVADPFIAQSSDFHLEMMTSYRSREKIARAIVTGWAMRNGERVAIREEHRQRAYSEREIVSALADAHLAPVDVMDFDPYHDLGSIDAETVKLFFVVSPRA